MVQTGIWKHAMLFCIQQGLPNEVEAYPWESLFGGGNESINIDLCDQDGPPGLLEGNDEDGQAFLRSCMFCR